MFDRLNAQQQPFIQSGYGAMGRLNTLLGIGSGGGRARLPAPGAGEMPLGGNATLMPRDTMYRPTPSGGVRAQAAVGPAPQNIRLANILALRARNGDTQAAQMLENL